MAPALQGQHPMPVSSASQQFSPAGQVMHPGQGQQPLQYSQPMQHLQSRPLQPGPVPPSQATQMPYLQQNMTYASGQQQYQQAAPANGHGYGGPGVPLSSSYTVRDLVIFCFLHLGIPLDFILFYCFVSVHCFIWPATKHHEYASSISTCFANTNACSSCRGATLVTTY